MALRTHFETEDCYYCAGSGSHYGTCPMCAGAGEVLTARGRKAEQFYINKMFIHISDLLPGTIVYFEHLGKWVKVQEVDLNRRMVTAKETAVIGVKRFRYLPPIEKRIEALEQALAFQESLPPMLEYQR